MLLFMMHAYLMLLHASLNAVYLCNACLLLLVHFDFDFCVVMTYILFSVFSSFAFWFLTQCFTV